jgi:hypothetical protein
MQSELEDHDFEVNLAVGVSPDPSAAPDGGSSNSYDADDLESFFSEHGFEYVDGDANDRRDGENTMPDMGLSQPFFFMWMRG